MSVPRDPGFPDGKRTNVWRAAKAILRASDKLASVKTWRTWEGRDPAENAEPTPEQCPWIMLTPMDSSVSSFSEIRIDISLVVEIRAAVAGTNYENAMNLWEAIEDSLGHHAPSPTPGMTVSRWLREAHGLYDGSYSTRVTFAGLSPKAGTTGGRMIVIGGRFECKMTKEG